MHRYTSSSSNILLLITAINNKWSATVITAHNHKTSWYVVSAIIFCLHHSFQSITIKKRLLKGFKFCSAEHPKNNENKILTLGNKQVHISIFINMYIFWDNNLYQWENMRIDGDGGVGRRLTAWPHTSTVSSFIPFLASYSCPVTWFSP